MIVGKRTWSKPVFNPSSSEETLEEFEPGIQLEKVTKRFRSEVALDTVSLEVHRGELFVILGPSGCGKTTLLRCIAGLEPLSEGRIFIGGRPMDNVPPFERSCAMVFQHYALFPHMTVFENIIHGLLARRYRNVSPLQRVPILLMSGRRLRDQQLERQVDRVLSLVGMVDLADRMPSNLSAGEQQRVALARALVTDPSVLLLDEPLCSLDLNLRLRMKDEIRRIQQSVGITCIYVTHDQHEAFSIADRVAVMRSGRIEQVCPPDVIYNRPSSAFVADFIGISNVFQGRIDDKGRKKSIFLSPNVRIRCDTCPTNLEIVNVVVRPENVDILAGPIAMASTDEHENRLQGVIVRREFMGAHSRVTVLVGGLEFVALMETDLSRLFSEGQTVTIVFPLSAVQVLPR